MFPLYFIEVGVWVPGCIWLDVSVDVVDAGQPQDAALLERYNAIKGTDMQRKRAAFRRNWLLGEFNSFKDSRYHLPQYKQHPN